MPVTFNSSVFNFVIMLLSTLGVNRKKNKSPFSQFTICGSGHEVEQCQEHFSQHQKNSEQCHPSYEWKGEWCFHWEIPASRTCHQGYLARPPASVLLENTAQQGKCPEWWQELLRYHMLTGVPNSAAHDKSVLQKLMERPFLSPVNDRKAISFLFILLI